MSDSKMKQITRREAESIFQKSQVISSRVEQTKKEMNIFLITADQVGFLIKYNLVDRKKTYFIREGKG